MVTTYPKTIHSRTVCCFCGTEPVLPLGQTFGGHAICDDCGPDLATCDNPYDWTEYPGPVPVGDIFGLETT